MALTLNTTPGDAVTISVRIAETEDRLRDALLAGAPTRSLHAEIAALKAEAARLAADDAATRAAAEAEVAQAHQNRVTEAVNRYVADIAQRMESRLAALVPPPFPTQTTRSPRR